MQKVKLRRCQQNYNEKVMIVTIDNIDNDLIVIYQYGHCNNAKINNDGDAKYCSNNKGRYDKDMKSDRYENIGTLIILVMIVYMTVIIMIPQLSK